MLYCISYNPMSTVERVVYKVIKTIYFDRSLDNFNISDRISHLYADSYFIFLKDMRII